MVIAVFLASLPCIVDFHSIHERNIHHIFLRGKENEPPESADCLFVDRSLRRIALRVEFRAVKHSETRRNDILRPFRLLLLQHLSAGGRHDMLGFHGMVYQKEHNSETDDRSREISIPHDRPACILSEICLSDCYFPYFPQFNRDTLVRKGKITKLKKDRTPCRYRKNQKAPLSLSAALSFRSAALSLAASFISLPLSLALSTISAAFDLTASSWSLSRTAFIDS